jgi:hypothetical protein
MLSALFSNIDLFVVRNTMAHAAATSALVFVVYSAISIGDSVDVAAAVGEAGSIVS